MWVEHTSTLATVNNRGALFKVQGRLDEAEAMDQRALRGYEKALGPEYTSTLDAVNNLGVLFRVQGRLYEAEALYQWALRGKEKALDKAEAMDGEDVVTKLLSKDLADSAGAPLEGSRIGAHHQNSSPASLEEPALPRDELSSVEDSETPLNLEQGRALDALHRTLLHEDDYAGRPWAPASSSSEGYHRAAELGGHGSAETTSQAPGGFRDVPSEDPYDKAMDSDLSFWQHKARSKYRRRKRQSLFELDPKEFSRFLSKYSGVSDASTGSTSTNYLFEAARKPGDSDLDIQGGTPHDADSVSGRTCYVVPGTIDGIPVNALPDSGSMVSAVSEDFAKRHGLPVLEPMETLPDIPLLGQRRVQRLGITFCDFKFRGEVRNYGGCFNVLRGIKEDVVLGRDFLDETETLTVNRRRVAKMIRPVGEAPPPLPQLSCTINGIQASVFPDTGSDLMLVSGDFARRNKLRVDRGWAHRTGLELIDGSVVFTAGVIHRTVIRINGMGQKALFNCVMHVLEDLPCDAILSNEFIFENNILSRFGSLAAGWARGAMHGLFVIRRRVESWVSRLFSRKKPADEPDTTPDRHATTAWRARWDAEQKRRDAQDLKISMLREALRPNARAVETRMRELWDAANPIPPDRS